MSRLREVKTIFVGDSGVGKTAIALQAVSGAFTGRAAPTIGAGHYVLDLPSGGATLSIWDTAGQENYRSLVPMYVRDAEFALVVFDVTSRASYENIGEWGRQVRAGAPACVTYLVGNKVDLADARQISAAAAASAIGRIGAAGYVETSAVTGQGIQELIRLIEDGIGQRQDDDAREDDEKDNVELGASDAAAGWGSYCC
jgi:small GTP-binding protein